jgi:hypothetical protein
MRWTVSVKRIATAIATPAAASRLTWHACRKMGRARARGIRRKLRRGGAATQRREQRRGRRCTDAASDHLSIFP